MFNYFSKDPSMEWTNYEFDRDAYELRRVEVTIFTCH